MAGYTVYYDKNRQIAILVDQNICLYTRFYNSDGAG